MKRLSVFSWPIWLKLTVAITIAIMVPVMVLASVFVSLIYETNIETLRGFVTENGIRQQQSIENRLQSAQQQVEDFVRNTRNSIALNDVLREGDLLLPSQVPDLLQEDLIDASDGLISEVGLIVPTGRIIMAEAADGSATVLRPRNVSFSTYFRAAQELANTRGRSTNTVFVASDFDGQPLIVIIHLLLDDNLSVLGYMALVLDTNVAIRNELGFIDDTIPAQSFIALPNEMLVGPPEEDLNSTGNSVAISRALQGETGTDEYFSNEEIGYEVIGYYAPISIGSQIFGFITEIDVTLPEQQLITTFSFLGLFLFIGLILLGGILVWTLNRLLSPPLQRLNQAARAMTMGDFEAPLGDTARGDEIGLLAGAFADMRQQVRTATDAITHRLEERVRDVRVTQEISRVAVTQRDARNLMDRVVHLVVERFPVTYHAQIFLLDDANDYAILEASTGEVGRQLLARGHRLRVGSLSIVGQATEQNQVVIANDIQESDLHHRNEFLPDTRSELAIPLRFGESPIGVLDVQSRQRDVFNTELVNILQAMADQISIAIQNARLYQEAARRLQEIDLSNQLGTRRNWEQFMNTRRVDHLTSAAGHTTGLDFAPLQTEAIETGEPAIGELTERRTIPIVVPIRLRGEILGTVQWEIRQTEFDYNKVLLAEELVNRLAISLDNARLFQDSQRTADRERLVNLIAAKLSAQTDISSIMQTAVREVGQALQAPQVSINLRGSSAGRAPEDMINGKEPENSD